MVRDFTAPFRRVGASPAAVAMLALALAGCGIKGPLRLPPADAPKAESGAGETATPAPADAPQRKP